MVKNFFSTKTLLVFIFVLGLLIRFYKLGEIPQVLTRDEAATGYNAYSILKTGRDEYGVKLPVYFLSFGDYKNPLYIYLTSLLIPVFGLNEFTVRFLAALSGSLTIIVSCLMIKELLHKIPNSTEATQRRKNEEKTQKGTKIIGLISALLLAISPWHIFYSRMAYEATLALFFVIFGVYSLLRARIKPIFFLPSLTFFILSFFTYNPPIFILPLLIPLIIFFIKITILEILKTQLSDFYSFFIFQFLVIFCFLKI